MILNGVALVPGTDYDVVYRDAAGNEVTQIVGAGDTPASYTAGFTGKGNYIGSIPAVTFTVTKLAEDAPDPVDLASDAVAAGTLYDFEYNGLPQRQASDDSLLFHNGTGLRAGVDYTVAYGPCTDAGTVGIVLTGIVSDQGGFTGTRTLTYKITPAQLQAGDLEAPADVTYTGTAQRPQVFATHTLAGQSAPDSLTEGIDYTVRYANNVNVGTATVTITGKGNFAGTDSATFQIAGKSLATAAAAISNQVYTGNPITPSPVVVVLDGQTLALGHDFTVSYNPDPVQEVGSYRATITAASDSNYTGSVTAYFKVISVPAADVADPDQVTIDAKDPLTGIEVRPENVKYTYNTERQQLELVVTHTDADGVVHLLEEGSDYAAAFSNDVNAGTAMAVVTGKGRYTGVVVVEYKIDPTTIMDKDAYDPDTAPADTVGLVDHLIRVVYTGGPQDAGVQIMNTRDQMLIENVDYRITYRPWQDGDTETNPSLRRMGARAAGAARTNGAALASNGLPQEVGEYLVTVTGMGNYRGEVRREFTINPATPASQPISIQPIADQVFNGSAVEPAVVVKAGSITLVPGEDYDVEYENNEKVGTATAKVTLGGTKGNYENKNAGGADVPLTGAFKILPASIADAVASVSDMVAGDPADRPDAKVVLNGIELTPYDSYAGGTQPDADYTVTYERNGQPVTDLSQPGTYTAVIKAPAAGGTGNYTGEKRVDFKVLAASEGVVRTVSPIDDQTYRGEAITPAVEVLDATGNEVDAANYEVSYSNNVQVGTATVVVKGKNGYTGLVSRTFRITPYDLSAHGVVSPIAAQTYTGQQIKPKVTVVVEDPATPALDGRTIKLDADYTAAYGTNVRVGDTEGSVDATGTGNYQGTVGGTFAIVEASLAGARVSAPACTYNGSQQQPAVTVTVGNRTLTQNTDFTVAYSGNVNVGTARITVTGTGNYSGTAFGSFPIRGLSIADAVVTATPSSYGYEPGGVVPTYVDVRLNGTTLQQGRDYTLDYRNNTVAGTAQVVVTGRGNYEGTALGSYTIEMPRLDDTRPGVVEVKLDKDEYPATGEQITPTVVSVTVGGVRLVEGRDYEVEYGPNVDPDDEATGAKGGLVTIVGKPGSQFAGQRKDVPFSIISIQEFGEEHVTLNPTNYVYNGTARTPAATVKVGDVTLTPGTDYVVTYENNVGRSGANTTAVAVITGRGLYDGTVVRKPFTIAGLAAIGSAAVALNPGQYVYDGDPKTPDTTVTLGGVALVRDQDYTVTYGNNVGGPNANATAVATIRGIGAFAGTKQATFTIVGTNPAVTNLGAAAMTLNPAACTYTGKALTPMPTVTLAGATLVPGVDYTVSYANNVGNPTQVSSGTVTVTGKGAFAGQLSKSFTINPSISIAKASVKLSGTSYTYNGSPKKPTATVTLNGKRLRAGVDYKITYSNNVGNLKKNVTAKAIITGIGAYKDSVSKSFTIKAGRKAVYRLYKKSKTGENLYTTSASERNRLKKRGYKYAGVAWYSVAAANKTPVYRLYQKKTGDHFYTKSASERNKMVRRGWKYEGIAFYSQTKSQGTPIYCAYKSSLKKGKYVYTRSKSEYNKLIKKGYKKKGIVFYGTK